MRDCPTPTIVESWLAPSTRGIVRAGLARARIDRMVEVWCDCAPEEARRRYADRARHPGHFDAELLPDLDAVLAAAEPLGLGVVVHVSTDRPVDLTALVPRLRAALEL